MKKAIANGKKLITIFSVLSILAVSILSVFVGNAPIKAKAYEMPQNVEVWDGYDSNTNNVTFEGSGSATDPYLIKTGDQLWKMVKDYGIQGGSYATYKAADGKFYNSANVEVFPAHYRIENDIYLNDITNYDQWGTDGFDMSALNNWRENAGVTATFYGQLDGNGHTIYGLYVNADSQAAFLAGIGKDASVKNLHFRNTYVINTYDLGAPVGATVDATTNWNICAKGATAVVAAYCTGDSNNYTVDTTVSNCSIIDAYVEGKYLVAGLFGYIDGSVPTAKNCIIADTELFSSELDHAGAVVNSTWGPYEKVATIEAVISIGNPLYGTGYYKAWDGHKHPHATCMYNFKDCYSDVRHSFNIEHPENGSLSHTEASVNLTKEKYVVGEAAKDNLDIDWEYNWRTTDGYPVPNNEYIVPTGEQYYANGGPKSDTDFWNGKSAKVFAAGTGTVDDPYLIETCEQFYKMVSTLNTTDYYKIADGVKALYFNNVEGFTYQETYDYLSNSKRAHIYNPGNNNFGGYFDGNGVTIYGVKAEAELMSGLFPKVNTCTLKNFTVKNSYFYAPDDNNSTTVVEGASAVVADLNSNAAVSLRNIAVIDCYVNSLTRAAGLVACSHTGGAVFIDDCIVAGGQIMSDEGTTGTAAFVAASNSGTHTIKNSIALGVYPAADNTLSYGSRFVNVYTDYAAPSSIVQDATGISPIDTNKFLGTAVKTTAAEFDWVNTWSTTDKEPMPMVHKAVFGTPGSAWTGKIADAYAGGKGTATDPYQINTPERLAEMIMYCQPGAYYELTEDIVINAALDDTAINWFTSADTFEFTGILDGKGKTISGLYYDDVKSGEYAGLIPLLGSGGQIRNVIVKDSSLNGSKGAIMGTIVGTVADGASNTTTIRACSVDETVKLSGAADAAGIAGRVGLAKLKLDNSISVADMSGVTGKKAGLVGVAVGKLEIKESISVGTYPFYAKEGVVATSIYTDTDDQLAVDGVIVLENSQMKGENAKTYMTALDFEEGGTWTTNVDNYPSPTGNSKPFDGVPGEPWTGEVANKFAGGSGSPSDPYLIATGEQLALMITGSDSDKSFKLIGDIYLNDVYDPLWKDLVGCSSWYSSYETSRVFTGVFDGDGYGVFGMYYNNPSAPKNTFIALFPRIADSAVIKNVAVSHAYIDANVNEGEAYAGGIFANCGSLGSHNLYSDKAMPADTVNDEYKGVKLPVIEQCIVDHNSIIKCGNVGGIGSPGGGVVVIRDCIVTATLQGLNESRAGALIGNTWSGGHRIYDSLAFPQNEVKSSAGVHQWIEDEAGIYYYHEDVYYHGGSSIYGTSNVPRPQWRIGEEAKTAMPNLDWENVWVTVPASSVDGLPGTPIQKVFTQEGRKGDLFSDTTFNIPTVQIIFITGDSEVNVEPISGKPYESVTLPTVSRAGYEFTGWYSFSDITLPYPYEYFLARDIMLYAGWEKVGVIQNFESYIYSNFDCDPDRWNYNKPGSRGGYNFDYVHGGTKSMQLLSNSAESADLLVNYEDWLTVDQEYTMTFWVATDTPGTEATLSLVQNNHPQVTGNTAVSAEPMVTVTGLEVGKWKQYAYSFKAATNWVSIRATGNSSLYIDDIVIAPTGTIINDNYVNGDLSVNSPNTADVTAVAIVVAVVSACAVMFVLTKKNSKEVIEKI